MAKTIRLIVLIRSTPRHVFNAPLKEKRQARFTGGHARIGTKAGSPCSRNDGHSTGYTSELVPGKCSVQAWRAHGWPAGTFSPVTFAPAKAAGGKTKLGIAQCGVPAGDFKVMSGGWKTHYWKPLKTFLV